MKDKKIKIDYEKLNILHEELSKQIVDFDEESFLFNENKTFIDLVKKNLPYIITLILILLFLFV